MKKFPLLIITILLGLMLVLSACVPGPRVTGSPGVALSDDYVFVAYRNFVYRLNVSSGEVDWQYPEEANARVMFYSQPLVTEDFVYIGDLANNFHKIDIETGQAEWTFSEAKSFFIGQAAEDRGIVYAPSDDGNLYAIDENNQLIWSFETDLYLWAQPQITEDVIILAAMDHFIYGINKDGEGLWSFQMGGAVVGSPVLSEDSSKVYAGSIGKDFVALDVASGEQLWTFNADDSLWGGAVLVNDLLYLADASGNLYGINPGNGDLSFKTEFEGSAVGGVAVIEDGVVLATEQGAIKAFNFDGSPKWEATLEGEIFQAPVVNDEYLIVGTIEGENLVYGFSLSGVQRWSTTPEN